MNGFGPLIKKAVSYIVSGQTALGGWGYGDGIIGAPPNAMTVTGWQIQALEAAHLAGPNLPGVAQSLDKAVAFIKKWQGNEGGFGFDRPENRVDMTGVGVLSTLKWKQSKDRVVKEGIDYLLGRTNVQYHGTYPDLCAWYYDSYA